MRNSGGSVFSVSRRLWEEMTRPVRDVAKKAKPAPTRRQKQAFAFVVGEELHWRRALTRSEGRAQLKKDLKLPRLPLEAAGERRLRRQKRSQPVNP